MKVTIEEGGVKRAFKMTEGRLSIGSGDKMRLKVLSEGVAEDHCAIILADGRATLRVNPGVIPPELDGLPVMGEVPMAEGKVLVLGQSRIWLGDLAAAGAVATPTRDPIKPRPRAGSPAAAPRQQAQAPAAPRRAAGGSAKDQIIARRKQAVSKATQAANAAPRRGVVTRTRPRVKKGLPGWALACSILGATGMAVFLLQLAFESGGETEGDIQASLNRLERHLEDGELVNARSLLDRYGSDAALTPALLQEVERLNARYEEMVVQGNLSAEHQKGTQYLDTKLVKYEKQYLSGNPGSPQIREFLKRCRYFKLTWPGHSGQEWVDRQESRFRGLVDLSSPATYADIAWEIRSITRTSPRKYKEGFRILERFMESCTPSERTEALALKATMESDREEYHHDRMLQADYEFKRDKPEDAVYWLVYGVIDMGVPEMENEAAEYLVRIPDADEHLRGWHVHYPNRYAALLKNSIISDFADLKGLPRP